MNNRSVSGSASSSNTTTTTPMTIAITKTKTTTTIRPLMVESSSSSSSSPPPPAWMVSLGLMTAQMCFGVGSVISALGLPACNPFAFALYREIGAGIMLVATSYYNNNTTNTNNSTTTTTTTKQASSPLLLMSSPRNADDWKWFIGLGLALFGNQAAVLAGIKLAGPVAAAVWQPLQPILTAAICMMLKLEPVQPKRIVGILIAFCGCICMVWVSTTSTTSTTRNSNKIAGVFTEENGSDLLHDNSSTSSSTSTKMKRDIVGNFLFFINCTCTSIYVLLSKQVLKKNYPSTTVTAWSYNIAAVFMFVLANVTSWSPTFMTFLCPDCTHGLWYLPQGAYFALLYNICFKAVLAYTLITWCNKYATGTLVIGYTVLQPVVTACLTLGLVGMGFYPKCATAVGDDDDDDNNIGAVVCLDPPGWDSTVGILGVVAGLWMIIQTEPLKKKEDDEEAAKKKKKEYDPLLYNHHQEDGGRTDDTFIIVAKEEREQPVGHELLTTRQPRK